MTELEGQHAGHSVAADEAGTRARTYLPPARMRGRNRLKSYEAALFAGVVVLWAVFGMAAPGFATAANAKDLAVQIAILVPMVVGMTLVVIAREIDLSVASVLALSGVILSLLLTHGVPTVLAVAIVILGGAAVGAVNGSLVSYLGVSSFMVTLAALSIGRGLALSVTNGNPAVVPRSLETLGSSSVARIPVTVLLMAAVAILGSLALRYTAFGRRLYAIGGNAEAARLFGLPVNSTLVGAFACSGALAAVAGVIVTARLSIASPIVGYDWELTVITAVVVGGTSLLGGRGSILGGVLGVILLQSLTNGLTLINISPFLTLLISGVLIFGVVVLDRVRRLGRVAA